MDTNHISWHWGWLGIDISINTEEINTGSPYTKVDKVYLFSGNYTGNWNADYWQNYPNGQGQLQYHGGPKLTEYTYGGVGQPFEGLPHNLDSFFSMPDNQTAYAFKGSMYYKCNLETSEYTHETPNYPDDHTGVVITGGVLVSSGTYTEDVTEGFTLTSSNSHYNGNWIKTGLVDRVGNGFVSSTDVGIYRHNYGSDAYVLYNFREGIPESPVWVLTRYGNNEGANSITPDHDHLNAVGFHGTQIQLVTGESQTFNGIKYPPSELLDGTMIITGTEVESTGAELESTGANLGASVGATNYQVENTKHTQGYISCLLYTSPSPRD